MEASTFINPLDLQLDNLNPRFYMQLENDQSVFRKYLFDHYEITNLASKIVQYGGLMPGERVLVFNDGERYRILEGNRRVCSLQCLLDPVLVPAKYQPIMPNGDHIRSSIEKIEVDILPSRDSALSILANRHIGGVLKWSPLAKQRFIATLFEQGKSITEIADMMLENGGKISSYLKEYYTFKCATDLLDWTNDERQQLESGERLKTTPFTRLFNLKDSTSIIGFSFNNFAIELAPDRSKDDFDKIIHRLAKLTLFDKTITTRSTLKDAAAKDPVLGTLLWLKEEGASPQISSEYPVDGTPTSSSDNHPAEYGPDTSADNFTEIHALDPASASPQSQSEASGTKQGQNPKGRNKQKPDYFFEGFNAKFRGPQSSVNAILEELISMSSESTLKKYPNAASMLFRTVLEQSIKYHLKKNGHWSNVAPPNGQDPGLDKLIGYINSNMGTVIPDKTYQRMFNSTQTVATKTFFDLIIHHPDKILSDHHQLESASVHLRGLIAYFLS